MKRRIACMIMAMMLVISLLPLGVIPAQAASNLNYSESLVSLVKQFEGFSATAYWDVSQWTIGYGTTGSAGQTMTEAQADLALRDRLNTINSKINEFTARNNLYLNQYQHDALVCFSFNCGTDWTTQGGRFFEAVTHNSDVNTFLFAISLWANMGSTPDKNLLNRRLAEANLYLNGVYSTYAPSSYTYVILDPNGGVAGENGEDKMQAYLSGSNVSILAANPTKSGASFGGWFTSPTGGSSVKYLSSSTAGNTLYAQYGVPVSITSTYSYLRNGAGSNYTQIGTVNVGTQLVIVETAQVNNVLWGRCADGWLELSNTNYTGTGISSGSTFTSTSTSTAVTATGTVVCNTGVNVRSGAGTGYPIVGSAYNGQRLSIYETVSVNGSFWGRIGNNRWISLNYVKLDSNSGNTGNTGTTGGVTWEGTGSNNNNNNNTNTTYQLGTVTATGLNVRSGAGVGYSIVGAYRKGDQVKIYAQSTANGMTWGQTDKGWVSMNYIQLVNNNNNNNSNNGTVLATGTVRANTNLNVRNGAGVGYTRVGNLTGGTAVNIYERVTVNGAEWGRIGTNQWVCMTYIRMNSNSNITIPSTGYQGRVTTNMNVRAGAGTNNAIVGRLTAGTVVTVYELTNVNGVSWGRIASGWVCMNYIQLTTNGGATWQ